MTSPSSASGRQFRNWNSASCRRDFATHTSPAVIAIAPAFISQCKLGILQVEGIRIGPASDGLQAAVNDLCRRRTRFFDLEHATKIPGVQKARELFRRLGTDPNKTRPCSEMFLRHILRSGEFYQVLNLVDLTNWSSAEIASPICVYDRSHIEGGITLRPGVDGETFESIRGKQMDVRGRPVLSDQAGVFGSPFADSARTRIRPDTVEALVVWFTLSEYPNRALTADIETYAERLTQYDIGHPGQIEIVT